MARDEAFIIKGADIIGHAIYKPSKRKRACDRGQTFARYNVYR